MGITEGGFHRGNIPTPPVNTDNSSDGTDTAPRGFPAVRPSFGRVDASALNTQTVEVPFFQPNFSQDRDATPLKPPVTVTLPNGLQGNPAELARGPQANDAAKAAASVLFTRTHLGDHNDTPTTEARAELAKTLIMIHNGLNQPLGSPSRIRAEQMSERLIREAGSPRENTT